MSSDFLSYGKRIKTDGPTLFAVHTRDQLDTLLVCFIEEFATCQSVYVHESVFQQQRSVFWPLLAEGDGVEIKRAPYDNSNPVSLYTVVGELKLYKV